MVRWKVDILEAVSALPPQEIIQFHDWARIDFARAVSHLPGNAMPDRHPHSMEWINSRGSGKVGPEAWEKVSRLVEAQPERRFPAPEDGEDW